VEDEQMILDITAMILERLGYHVLKCGSSQEALQLAGEYRGPVHLIMTDVVMPEMNGAELAKHILRFHPQAKLLVMSGYTADIVANHGVVTSEVHFLQKPFNMKTLSEKLREVLKDDGASPYQAA
jgi:DNA-binding NtrC family response regulator